MPHIIIIAGANGAGKTSAAPAILRDALHVSDYVNADIIAQGLCGFAPNQAAFEAGRIMLTRLQQLAKERANFAFETTLASKTFATWISGLKEQGYYFHLTYLWLKNPELAISRVTERVKLGGHDVPEPTIRRRYHGSLKNFFNLYQPLTNSWQFYDNSNSNQLNLIASGIGTQALTINDSYTWKTILEAHNEK